MEIDLLIDRGSERIGIELKAGSSVQGADATHLQAGLESGVIHRGAIIYAGDRRFPLQEDVEVIPAADALIGAPWP